jgi:hypothetical protein
MSGPVHHPAHPFAPVLNYGPPSFLPGQNSYGCTKYVETGRRIVEIDSRMPQIHDILVIK